MTVGQVVFNQGSTVYSLKAQSICENFFYMWPALNYKYW
jgi:hypothetical protein